MRRFTLSDTQAEAILNMRLRQLHKLEALAVEREHAEVATQQADLQALLADDGRCWAAIAAEIDAVARQFGAGTPLGRRRTTIEPITDAAPALAAFRPPAEPITVVCSARGWVRVLRGGVADPAAVRYKEGDGERFLVAAESSDRLLLTASNGRFYTLACDRLPAGRGFGEPLRLMLDIDDGHEPVALCVHRPGRRLLVASDSGRGFLVDEDATVASTRRGKAVFDLEDGERVTACIAVEADDDMVAIVGSNRKLLVFPLPEVPVLARGKGVILQRYRAGHLADVRVFRRTDGLTWRSGRGVRCETNLDLWLGRRGQGGRSVPRGFPASNRFG
jgi:topoisomerase-4 subunit A